MGGMSNAFIKGGVGWATEQRLRNCGLNGREVVCVEIELF